MSSTPKKHNMVLVLGGGAARALAHVGALSVLENEGIGAASVVGTSMGALLGALHAAGLSAREIAAIARGFRFPRWFVPGGLLSWNCLFSSAVPALSGVTFEQLAKPLAVVAVDLETGRQVVLDHGDVLTAVQASCAVPGVMAPVAIEGRLLVDGGVVNVLPVDLASARSPDLVLAIKVGSTQDASLPRVRNASFLTRLARLAPNPFSARLAFDVLVRSAEIALEHQNRLAAAMVPADVLVDVDVGRAGLRDFHLFDAIVGAGAAAMETALPALRDRLQRASPSREMLAETGAAIDPTCDMVVSAARAKARLDVAGTTYFFCSATCCEAFAADPQRYARSAVGQQPRRSVP